MAAPIKPSPVPRGKSATEDLRGVRQPTTTHEKPPSRMLLLSKSPWLRVAFLAVFGAKFRIHTCHETEPQQVSSAVASIQPDLILLDLIAQTPQMLNVLSNLRACSISTPVVGFCGEKTEQFKGRIPAGSNSFISWSDNIETAQHLMEAIWKSTLTQRRSQKTHPTGRAKEDSSPSGLPPGPLLSQRELQVFDLIGQGYTTRQISSALKLSVSTIETYRERLKEKLDLHTSNELLQRAIRWSRLGV